MFVKCLNLDVNIVIITEKLHFDAYVLFLVTADIFFNRSKIPTFLLSRINQETFISSLVPIGQVASKEKIFVRKKIKIAKKKAITPTWLNRLKLKLDHRQISSC